MKKLLPCLTLLGLLMLAVCGTAGAKPPTPASLTTMVAGTVAAGPAWAAPADRISPTVSAVSPASSANDIDTSVTISGSGFVATPTVSLGSTALTGVTWVNSTTLTATVPWGLNPGGYPLTVVNPDGGSVTLSNAYTVTPGIGQWNLGKLFGGQMQQLLMKPGDSNTLYATAYGVIGLFRSTDAGEHWAFVSDKPWANNNEVAVDPLHPDWLYVFTPGGLMCSTDEGDTWTTLTDNKWPDGSDLWGYPQVYVSPYQDSTHPQALFVSSCAAYVSPQPTAPKGLIKSTDGGAHWTIVPSLAGVPVQDVAFDPNDQAHVVLVTSDMRVYQSSDWGDSWTQVTTSGLTPSSLGIGGSITYNPGGSEVWIDAMPQGSGGGIFKSAATDLSNWQDVSQNPGQGSVRLAFTGPSLVYSQRGCSTDGGTSWGPFGPSPWYGGGWVMFDPTDPQTAYITNDAVGVQKTTDGGATWEPQVQGLTALSCTSMAVSPTDPLRVYAAFYGPLGIYRSLDGTSTWSFLPIPGAWQVRRVVVDPFDAQRVYAGADSGFYTSTDGGDTWTGTVWHLPPSATSGLLDDMAADPCQPGHLLACFVGGGTYGMGPGWLYNSTDYGATWQAVDVNPPSGVTSPHSIVFDPATPGTVYLAADGVYKSTDSGATWRRIDDPKQPGMAAPGDIAIATHPQHMVVIDASGQLYRSVDDGATWQKAKSTTEPGGADVFVDGDSTRLYRATGQGLFFSSDVGDTWEPAAGVLGQVQTTALGYADADGHTILYAATNGGQAGATSGTAARAAGASRATTDTLVRAGIYRYVQVPAPKVTLKLSGLKKGALKLGKRVTVTGKVTPATLAGSKVTLTVQKKKGHKWVTVKAVKRTIGHNGAYSWKYKPAKRGGYRLQLTIAKTVTHTAAKTTWRSFKVK